MTMIERVAKAIGLAEKGYADGKWEIHVDSARAAIEAMREPMAKMVDAGGEAIYELNGDPTPDVEAWAQTAWSAMIDAALAEK